MTPQKYAYMACLAPLLALWLPHNVQAQRPDDQVPRKAQRQVKPAQHPPQMKKAPSQRPASKPQHKERWHPNQPSTDMPHHMLVPSPVADIQIGRYFQSHHLALAKSYYSRPENMGFCPPGLAKKGSGCQPPGQAKLWRKGERLPQGVVYYDVPRSVVVTLGVPPPGYKYVRVASDILLIAIGTSMVIDAMEDLVR
jgi:Ni/Co efflux regulator RcnB